jgi:hypothetical protein
MSWGWEAPYRTPRPAGEPELDWMSTVRSEADAIRLHRFARAVGARDLLRIAARDEAMRRLDIALRLLI